MRTVIINLYEFSELQDKAREKAIYEHTIFLDSIGEEYENEEGEMVTEYPDHTATDAIESIEDNEYLFYFDGTMANCVTYCGKHPKAGATELSLHGETYKVDQA